MLRVNEKERKREERKRKATAIGRKQLGKCMYSGEEINRAVGNSSGIKIRVRTTRKGQGSAEWKLALSRDRKKGTGGPSIAALEVQRIVLLQNLVV